MYVYVRQDWVCCSSVVIEAGSDLSAAAAVVCTVSVGCVDYEPDEKDMTVTSVSVSVSVSITVSVSSV